MKIKKIDLICGIIIILLILILNIKSTDEICITEKKEIICSESNYNLSLYQKQILNYQKPYNINGTLLLNKKELRDYLGIISKSSSES